MESSVQAVVVVCLVVFVGFPVIGASFASAPTSTETVENETVANVSVLEDRAVQKSVIADRFYDNETVYFEGSEVNESEYRWDTQNGTIRAESGAAIGGDDVNVTYTYVAKSRWTKYSEQLLLPLIAIGGALVFAVCAFFFLGLIGLLGGGPGGR